jgi:hypothetical protein
MVPRMSVHTLYSLAKGAFFRLSASTIGPLFVNFLAGCKQVELGFYHWSTFL